MAGRGRAQIEDSSVSTSGGLHSPLGVFGLGSGPKQEILFVCGQHRRAGGGQRG